MEFIGCGALNWDSFFEVKDLSELSYKGKPFLPGREISLSPDEFASLFSFLKKRGEFKVSLPGGSAANTIYALSKWGFKTGFIGAVGEDEAGEKILEALKANGVDTSFVKKGGKTSQALIVIDEKKDRFIAVCPGTAEQLLRSEHFLDFSFECGLLHFSSFASNTGFEFQKSLLKMQIPKISFDPGEIYTAKGKEKISSFLKKTRYLFITQEELELLGESPVHLLEQGIKVVFLKQGKKGASFYQKGLMGRVSAISCRRIKDNTGAGDYFNAGVLAGLKSELSVDRAVELGCRVAALSLADYGSLSLPSKSLFQKLLTLVK